MLKIEVVRFEAQDVITASVCAPTEHVYKPVKITQTEIGEIHDLVCEKCGDKESVLFQQYLPK